LKRITAVICFLFLSLFVLESQANHVLGGNISYDCLGGDTYGVTMIMYKDCFGATAAPPTETIFFLPSNCSGVLPFSVSADLISTTEISDLCPTELVNSSCNGGLNPGAQALEYYIEVNLDPSCDWVARWSDGDWNYFINMDFSSLPTAYFETSITPSLGCLDGISIDPLGQVPYVCAGDPVSHTMSVNNPFGFFLEYSFSCPLIAAGVPAPTFSACDEPIPGATIDQNTGTITFTAPNVFGNYVVGVQIDVYDINGDFIGVFQENMAFTVRLCDTTPSVFDIPEIQSVGGGTTSIDATSAEVCVGDSLIFTVQASSTNQFRNITLSSDFTTVFPGGVFEQDGDNPAIGEFRVLTDETMLGTSTVNVELEDDNCPTPTVENIFLDLTVNPSLSVNLTDTLVCLGESVTLEAFGDTQYQWQVISGSATGLSGNGSVQTITATEDCVIEVIAVNAPAICVQSETISIGVALSSFSATITDESCAENDGAIDLEVIGGSGNFSYNWPSIPSNLQDPTGLIGATYDVTVTDLDLVGCSRDTSIVIGTTPPPTGSISGDVTICEGESADITFTLSGTGPFTIALRNEETGALEAVPLLNDGDTFSVSPLVNTTYTLESVTDANVPACSYTVESEVTITVRPPVTANFLNAGNICVGENLDLELDIDQAGTFDITYNDGVNPNVTGAFTDGDLVNVSPIVSTTYTIVSVDYQDAPTCPNTTPSAATVNVDPLPTADLTALDGTSNVIICEDDVVVLHLSLTGTGPWEIDHDFPGQASPLAVAFNEFDWSLGQINASSSVEISGVTDLGTNCSSAAFSDVVDIQVNPLPDFGQISGPTEVCEGTAPEVVFNGDPGNPIVVEIAWSTTPDALSGTETLSDGGTFSPAITTSGDVCLETVSIDYAPNPACTTTVDQCISILVNQAPEATVVDTICTSLGDAYQLVFTIENGDAPSYAVDLPGTISDNAGTWEYVSDANDPSVSTTWILDDANNCDPQSITIDPFVCPILTSAGTMDTDPLELCEDDLLEPVFNNDAVLDPNDVQNFVIHSSPTSTLGIVYYVSNAPSWDISNDLDFVGTLNYGQTYYVSSVVGDDDGAGNVDFFGGGVSVAEGTPFAVFENPSVSVSGGGSICQGETVDVIFDLQGTAPFTILYQIDGGPGTGFPINALNNQFVLSTGTAGTYTPFGVTSGGCSGTLGGSALVEVNPLPTATLSGAGSYCEGGSIDLDLNLTGAPDWNVTISYDDGSGNLVDEVVNIPSTPGIYTASAPGNYFVTEVSDANGCSNDADGALVGVTENPAPSATWSFTDSTICAGATVVLEATLTGTAPFTVDYLLDGAPFSEASASDVWTYTTNQAEVIEIVGLTDANTCSSVLNETSTIQETALPTADAGLDFELCSGETALIGTAAIAGYEYSWSPDEDLNDPAIAQPSFTPENVSGADIVQTLTVEVIEGFCSASDEVEVTIHPLPNANAGEDQLICYGETTSLQAAGGLSYEWLASPWIQPGDEILQNPSVTPLSDAEFVLTVTDAFSCQANDTITVFVPEELTVLETATDEVCFGVCDGEILLTPSGGWGTVSVDWTEAVNDDLNITDLCGGNYNYTLIDSLNCTLTGMITINELPDYFIDEVNITPPTCFGENTGVLEVLSATAVEYNLVDPETTNDSGIFAGLGAGSYDLNVTDANGCVADTSITFTELSAAMSISVPNDELIICVNQDITFSANAQGGDGDLTYYWGNALPPAGFESNENPYITQLQNESTYYVYALDGFACSTDTLSIDANFLSPISVDAGPDPVVEICQGECVDLTSLASGGNGVLSSLWVAVDGSPADTIAFTPNTTVCPDLTTEYTVLVNDGCSAEASATVLVTVYLTPEVTFTSDAYSGCFPLTVTLTNNTDPNLTENCIWDFQDGNLQPICGDIEYTFADPGTYTPSLTVTSANGCTSSAEIDLPIEVYDYPVADFTWTPNPVTTLENEVQLLNTSQGATLFEWTIGSGPVSIDDNPSFVLNPNDFASEEVCLYAESPFGCSNEICQVISLQSQLLVYVPNAFTPDGDGVNEVFKPVISGAFPDQYLFRIWDRWGNVVFQTEDMNEWWTGNVERGEFYGQNEVYHWEIQVISIETGEEVTQIGSVTLLR
jgi:gliding motility-associated-like protein